MISQLVAVLCAVLVAITSIALIISVDWRLSVVGLAVQYVGVFALVAMGWPISLALVKLVAGWMAGAVLGMAVSGMPPNLAMNLLGEGIQQDLSKPLRNRSGRLFRLFAIGMIGLLIFGVSPAIIKFIPTLKLEQAIGALFLFGMGMLQLSTTAQPLRVILGLLTVLSGFEVVYSGVEASTLVTGLLAGVNLGVALVGAYLLVNQLGESVS
jgi:hypothetical protein